MVTSIKLTRWLNISIAKLKNRRIAVQDLDNDDFEIIIKRLLESKDNKIAITEINDKNVAMLRFKLSREGAMALCSALHSRLNIKID